MKLLAVPIRVWLVLMWFLVFSSLFVWVSSWFIILLLLPIYWQVYLKQDLAPSWW